MEIFKMAFLLCLSLITTDAKLAPGGKELACSISADAWNITEPINMDAIEIYSLIIVESRWNKKAISNSNACGLTQVLPKYSNYTCNELMLPLISLQASVESLAYWLERAKGDKRLALCGYSHGNSCFNDNSLTNYHRGYIYADRVLSISKRIRKRYTKFEDNLNRIELLMMQLFNRFTGKNREQQ